MITNRTPSPESSTPPKDFRGEGFTGRNPTPIADGALGLHEETAADGQSVHEVLGDDIEGFCAALAGGQGARTYRDQWREQLNRNAARKLGQLLGSRPAQC